MDNQKKHFIVKFNDYITKLPSDVHGCTSNHYSVEFQIENNTLITKVDGQTFSDSLPMRGKRRNRKAIADIVIDHILDVWGGTREEISEYCQNFIKDFFAIFGVDVNEN